MAKSIRISDELYELALYEAGLMERSLAQQVEHWVKLGIGSERSNGATVEDVRAAALKYRHVLDEAAVRSKRKSPQSLHVIPAAMVKSAHVQFPGDAFASRRKSW